MYVRKYQSYTIIVREMSTYNRSCYNLTSDKINMKELGLRRQCDLQEYYRSTSCQYSISQPILYHYNNKPFFGANIYNEQFNNDDQNGSYLCYNTVGTPSPAGVQYVNTVGHNVVNNNSQYNNNQIQLSRVKDGVDNNVDYDAVPRLFLDKRSDRALHFQKSIKTITKRNKRRTVFTTEQIIALEEIFNQNPYVNRSQRQALVNRVNVSEKAIKVWFQNRRHLADKREKDQSISYLSDSSSEDISDTESRINYIESQISQNTDEFGYVTLNDNVMTELVSVIDDLLADNIVLHNSVEDTLELNNTVIETKIESPTCQKTIYEPISPVSLSEDSESVDNSRSWVMFEPHESLQRLLDVQNILLNNK